MKVEINLFNSLIGSLTKRKKKIKRMLESSTLDMMKKTPASTYYHDNYKGGLLNHSIFVTLKMLHDKNCYPSIKTDSIIFTGLFHDLGKLGSWNEPLYLPEKDGPNFYANKKALQIPHAARSIHILSAFNIHMQEDEFQAILYHNGLYVKSGKEIINNEFPLTLLMHHADMFVSHIFSKTVGEERKTIKKTLLKGLELL